MTHLTCSRSVLSACTSKAGSSMPAKARLRLIVVLKCTDTPRLHLEHSQMFAGKFHSNAVNGLPLACLKLNQSDDNERQ